MDRIKIETRRMAIATQAAQNLQQYENKDPTLRMSAELVRANVKILRDNKRSVHDKVILATERVLRGEDQSTAFPPSDKAKHAGVPVARLYELTRIEEPRGFATGFLVAPNILITNNHVFANENEAHDCVANFAFEQEPPAGNIHQGIVYKLRPDIFFYTHEPLDCSFVYVEDNPIAGDIKLSSLGCLPLIETKGKVTVGNPINIIQYPNGGIKKYTTQDNSIGKIDDDKGIIYYFTDTAVGSSGSPDFNEFWEVAGLHYTAVPEMNDKQQWLTTTGEIFDPERMEDSEVHWIYNAGKSVSKIVAHLKSLSLDGDQEQYIKRILSNTKDPLSITSRDLSGLPNAMPFQTEARKTNTPVLNNNTKKNTYMGNIVMNFSGPVTIYINQNQPSASSEVPTVFSSTTAEAEEKKERFDEDYDDRTGYNENFLNGFKVPMPTVIAERQKELYKKFQSTKPYIIPYHHYSLVMNKNRRMAMWTASNVIYTEKGYRDKRERADLGNGAWRLDGRIPDKYQIQAAEFYDPATYIDKGHLVRRDDNCWAYPKNGRVDSIGIEYANADTYHWTNCTPQHEAFNRDVAQYIGIGKWGVLENEIKRQLEFPKNDADNDNKDFDQKSCILAGPVLVSDDPEYMDIQYPLKFWKVFAINSVSAGNLVFGFILSQKDKIDETGLEKEGIPRFNKMVTAMQASLQEITDISGVIFDGELHKFDVKSGENSHELQDDFSNLKTGTK